MNTEMNKNIIAEEKERQLKILKKSKMFRIEGFKIEGEKLEIEI